MASIVIMLGGTVLNASTFIGGSYLAKYLSGSKTDQEWRRHDKALEKYQKDYAKYQENQQKLLDWQEQNRHEDAIASRNLENTDEALKLYNKFHPDENMQINEPVFSHYYRPSKEQRIGEMAYVSGGMMVLGYAASKWLRIFDSESFARFALSQRFQTLFGIKSEILKWTLMIPKKILLTLER